MNELTLMSFGYLYGLPEEADTVIGVLDAPNPIVGMQNRDQGSRIRVS